jgi:hypothetical protein
MTVGLLLRDVGRYEDSYNALIEAYFAASEDAPEVAADASLQLVSLLGEHLKRTHDGEVWARFAKEAIARIGADAGMREAMLANALGFEGRSKCSKRDWLPTTF